MSNIFSNSIKVSKWRKFKNMFERVVETENLDESYKSQLSSINFRPICVLEYKERCIVRIHKIKDNKIDIDNLVMYTFQDIDVAKLKASVIANNMGYDVGEL